jgi:ribosomal protein S24E
MDFKVISETDNPMLNRKEITAEIIFDAKTPSRAQLVDKAIEVLKADRKLIIIKKIEMVYGQRKASVSIRIYKNRKLLDRYEDNIRAAESVNEVSKPEESTESVPEKKEDPNKTEAENNKETPKDESADNSKKESVDKKSE